MRYREESCASRSSLAVSWCATGSLSSHRVISYSKPSNDDARTPAGHLPGSLPDLVAALHRLVEESACASAAARGRLRRDTFR